MKSKYILVGILLFVLLFSINVCAENTIQENIKSRINVPESYVVFNSAIADGNTSKFWWRTPVDAENGGEISVTVDANGNILSYYHFKNDYISKDEGAHFSVYNKSDARFFAMRFIEKICPDLIDNVEYNKSSLESDISKNMKTASVSYYRIENGIPYYDNYMNFIIDLNTAEVVQYTLKWDFDAVFPDVSDVISQPAAMREYNNKIGISLQFRVKEVNGEKIAYLVYCPEEENIFIDANTGKVLRNDIINNYINNNDQIFDEIIISEAEVENAVLNKVSAEEYIRKIPDFKLDNSYSLTYTSYEKINGSDCINLEFSKIPDVPYENMTDEEKLMYDAGDYSYLRVKVDLKNKDILWLRCYNKEVITERYITDEAARWNIEKLLKIYLPLKYDNCRFSEIYSKRINDIYKATYVCYVGEIPYSGNKITVEYDCSIDNIISLDCKWLNNVNFDNSTVNIDVEKAKEILFSKIPFNLTYINTVNGITAVYMLYPYYPAAVGADDGILKDIDGSNHKIRKYDDYTDLDGHYAQGIIMRLNNNLIVSSDDENCFKPDINVSQKDYLTWMVAALKGVTYENTEDLYAYLTVNNIITGDEISPEAEILKEDAIVFFIRALGYEDIAQATDIYRLSFADSDIISPDKYGYVAIAKGIGMISGDENNNVKPKTPLTRADACCIIYKYLAR